VFAGMRSFALRLPDSSTEASDAARRLLTCNRHIFIPPVIPEKKTEQQTNEKSPGRRKDGAGGPVDRRKTGACLRDHTASIEGSEDTFKVYMANTFKAPHVVPPPPQGAHMDTKMQFLHYQLDRIGQKTEVLNGLLLLGSGAQERFEGGAHTLIYPFITLFFPYACSPSGLKEVLRP
jgi:hypothetical protein